MPRRKNIRELGVLTKQDVLDRQYMGPMPVERIEPELQSLSSESVPLNGDFARCDDLFVCENRADLKYYSVSQEWHRPYVEALFETDEAIRGALIVQAERAIVGRFLELLISSVETDETLDLQNAAYVITELKKASTVAYTP
ncbi:MAG: hypothetical protein WBR26_13265 [Candidatus Acidiferrum sp.]